MNWVPGDGLCAWGAITGHPCDEPATRVAFQHDVIDYEPFPRPGVVAVGVCDEHGDRREWALVTTRDGWAELQEREHGRVWVVQSVSPVR